VGAGKALRFILPLLMVGASACRGQTVPQAAPFSLTPYCNRAVEIGSVLPPSFGDQTSPEERAEKTSLVAGRLVLLYEEQERSAPKALGEDIEAVIDLYREVVRTGDDALLSGAELGKYLNRLHSFEVSKCDFESVKVEAFDYSYEGVPEEVKAGVLSFELSNNGKENHELVLFRRNDGVEEPLDKLLKLPRAKFDEMMTLVGIARAAPGNGAFSVSRVLVGEYAVVCFQPTGEEGGPPHHTKGMFEQFKVA
jgi:hypothetical protein